MTSNMYIDALRAFFAALGLLLGAVSVFKTNVPLRNKLILRASGIQCSVISASIALLLGYPITHPGLVTQLGLVVFAGSCIAACLFIWCTNQHHRLLDILSGLGALAFTMSGVISVLTIG